ncbi:MAG: ribosome silencing factor [Micavibrio sp.]
MAVLKDLIEASLSDDKAQDIQIIDLRGHSALADYLVVASGTSTRHVASIAQKLCDRLSARGVKEVRTEGMTQANWVVVDTGDIIVHLFRPEVREFYNIEKMWSVTVPGSEGAAGIQSPGLGSLS